MEPCKHNTRLNYPLGLGFLLILLIFVGDLRAADLPPEIDAATRVRDYQKAYALLLPLANAGEAEAQYRLAGLYRAGRGVEANLSTAAAWLEKAAQQGHARAQHGLATMLQKGTGVPADAQKAEFWFNAAAGQGLEAAVQKLDQTTRVSPAEDNANHEAVRLKAFFKAVAQGQGSLLEPLLHGGLSANSRDPQGRTGLIVAATAGQRESVQLLIKAGADLEAVDRRGDNALRAAIYAEQADIVRLRSMLLISRDALPCTSPSNVKISRSPNCCWRPKPTSTGATWRAEPLWIWPVRLKINSW